MMLHYKKKLIGFFIFNLFLANILINTLADNVDTQKAEGNGFKYDVILNDEDFRKSIDRKYPECKVFLNKKYDALDLKDVEKCLLENKELTPTIADKILNHHPPISKDFLDKTLGSIIKSTFSTEHVNTIDRLIKAGASTDNFSTRIYSGNDTACGAVVLILEANKKQYQNKNLLNIKVKGFPRWLDLHFLTDTGIGRNLCSEAISTLVDFNKNLINYQSEHDGSTPLHEYLYDINHPDWNMEIAKLLISENNVNLQTDQDNTALHYLLLYNKEEAEKIKKILKTALDMGADLTLKNKEGITVKSLILERIDLMPLLM